MHHPTSPDDPAARQALTAAAHDALQVLRREQSLLDALPAMVSYWSRDLRIEVCNCHYAARFHQTPDQIRGRLLRDLVGDEIVNSIWQNLELALAGVPQSFERMVADPGAAPRRYSISYHPDLRDGEVAGISVVITDVTGRDDALTALVQSEERYRALFEHMQTGFALHEIVTDAANRPVDYVFLACNAAYTAMTGLRPEAIIGRRVTEVLPGTENDPADWIGVFGAVAITGKSVHLENYSEAIGHWYDVVAYRPAPRLFAVLIQDITEQREHARELAYRASHDTLTGLPNRPEFDSRLQRALATAHETGAAHALLYIDLDQFKIVNDACGHSVGDELLQQIADLLRRCVRAGDTLARLGGDEFGVILTHCDAEPAYDIAQGICQQIDAFRFIHEGRRYRIGSSIGIVPLDRRWPNAAAILQAADVACYTAKELGRNRVHAYTDREGAAQASQGLMRWATRLQEAIEEDRFVLYCQRIVALHADAGAAHYEILVRMIDESGALVLPGAFMPAAERYQLVGRIDRWVLQKVVDWLREHAAKLAPVGMLAVNLSGHSIGDRAFHRFAEEMLRASGVDAHHICFEVTETATISNIADATRFMVAMRALGCRFALDDFGSGLSSFGYLKTLPVDFLKIDGQFVRDAHGDPLDQATVRCIRDLARVVGKRTIAEWVESAEALELMRAMDIDFAQGYAVHRPEPIDAILHSSGS